MTEDFNDLPWHDAALQYIHIDRLTSRKNDNIKCLIEWPEGYGLISSLIEFYKCYAFTANMNLGIRGEESILTAQSFSDSEELSSIRKEWFDWFKGKVVLDELKCYQIITNSSNSD